MIIENAKISGAPNAVLAQILKTFKGKHFDNLDDFNEREAIIAACDALNCESTYPDAELLIEWGTGGTVKPEKVKQSKDGTIKIEKRKGVQTTRMIKCECLECGYVVRTSRKWAAMGLPICPVDKISMIVSN